MCKTNVLQLLQTFKKLKWCIFFEAELMFRHCSNRNLFNTTFCGRVAKLDRFPPLGLNKKYFCKYLYGFIKGWLIFGKYFKEIIS